MSRRSSAAWVILAMVTIGSTAVGQTVEEGAVPFEAGGDLLGTRYRRFGEVTSQQVFVGIPSLVAPGHRAENGSAYTWKSTQTLTLELDTVADELRTVVESDSQVVTVVYPNLASQLVTFGKTYLLSEMNAMQIFVRNGDSDVGTAVSLTDVELDGLPIGSFAIGPAADPEARSWTVTDIDLSGDFTLTATVDLSGPFSGSDEGNKIELSFGRIAICGDDEIDPSEDCEDGNIVDGDCCSSACTFEPIGSSCSDGNVCNGEETCDGAGICVDGDALECDDENPCSQDSCDPGLGCVAAEVPLGSCQNASKGVLVIKKQGGAKDKLIWKWIRGQSSVEQSDFATSAASAEFSLCVYAAGGAERVHGAYVPSGPGWKAIGGKGFKYRDRAASADGIKAMVMKGGAPGKSKVVVRGKGVNLEDPALPVDASDFPVVTQLLSPETDECWQSVFDEGHVKRNDGEQFRAKRRD